MRIKKIGQLNEKNEIIGKIPTEVIEIFNRISEQEGSCAEFYAPVPMGFGSSTRTAMLLYFMPQEILSAQLSNPTSLNLEKNFEQKNNEYFGIFMFRNQVFIATTDHLDESSEEEALLLIKKHIYSEDNRLKRLKQEVEAMERVINNKDYGRTVIPENVKLLVFARDEGKCIRCGSMENLHFDHIIPVSKGGGSSEKNIQLLCDYCNLQKSDKIGFRL
jgi:hypothetical protein